MHSEGTAGRRKVSQGVEWGVRRQQQRYWKANSRMPHHLTKRTWYFETSPKRSGRRWRPCNYEHGISDLQHLHASRNWRMSTDETEIPQVFPTEEPAETCFLQWQKNGELQAISCSRRSFFNYLKQLFKFKCIPPSSHRYSSLSIHPTLNSFSKNKILCNNKTSPNQENKMDTQKENRETNWRVH